MTREILFVLVPLLIGVAFLIILFQLAKNVAEWADNNSRPIETTPAKVVAKRSATGGNMDGNSGGTVSTFYYATFELESGERREFLVSGSEFGMLVEKDQGSLTHQGTRYHRFDRDR